MKKHPKTNFVFPFVFTLLLSVLTACQEIKISIELPGNKSIPSISASQTTPIYFPTKTITLATATPEKIMTETPLLQTPTMEVFNPASILLSLEDFPQDVYFSRGHLKIYNVSYLYSPGKLVGTAYVREYFSYPHDLLITQVLVHSPVKITPEMMRAGFYSSDVYPVEEKDHIGDLALAGQRDDQFDTLSYRFSKDNLMVVLTVQGGHKFANFENLVKLAGQIYKNIPDNIPENPDFPVMSTTLNKDLFDHYFYSLDLVNPPTDGKTVVTDQIQGKDQSFWFRSNTKNLVLDLKTGIYSKQYEKLFYIKEFTSFIQLGEVVDEVKHPVWDFGWQHLPEGEYEIWFWVEDELVAKLPFTFIPQ